ncbi:MAG: flagellar protein FlaG [Roseibium sp.]|nr:flagellar protein FlaG [Roseibium sp.]
MDTGLARPPLPSYTAITPVTRAPERTEPAARTELPATRTVTPATQTEDTRQTDKDSPPDQRVERHNVVDPDSKSLVFIATDSASGEVIRQVPSETLLKLRAYAKSIADQAEPAQDASVKRTV